MSDLAKRIDVHANAGLLGWAGPTIKYTSATAMGTT